MEDDWVVAYQVDLMEVVAYQGEIEVVEMPQVDSFGSSVPHLVVEFRQEADLSRRIFSLEDNTKLEVPDGGGIPGGTPGRPIGGGWIIGGACI